MPKHMTYDHEGHHYAEVAAYSESVHDTVIPNGETWHVLQFVANGAYLDDTAVGLWWDRGGASEALLAASHGDAVVPVDVTITGDGSKKLSIVLQNDTGSSHLLGGHWDAEHE